MNLQAIQTATAVCDAIKAHAQKNTVTTAELEGAISNLYPLFHQFGLSRTTDNIINVINNLLTQLKDMGVIDENQRWLVKEKVRAAHSAANLYHKGEASVTKFMTEYYHIHNSCDVDKARDFMFKTTPLYILLHSLIYADSLIKYMGGEECVTNLEQIACVSHEHYLVTNNKDSSDDFRDVLSIMVIAKLIDPETKTLWIKRHFSKDNQLSQDIKQTLRAVKKTDTEDFVFEEMKETECTNNFE